MALTPSTDPLVWIDCEMTGLNPHTDTILSISCLLTTASLQPLETAGFDAIILTPPTKLSRMDDWCTRTHTASGLTSLVLSSPPAVSATAAADALLSYIQTHIPTPRTALLAGNSIHMDRAFLSVEPWDRVLAHLHYRVLDVSSMKEAVRRWAPREVVEAVPRKEERHEARRDVEESVEEARYYMRLLQGVGKVE